MFSSIGNILNNLPPKAKLILAIALSIFIATIPSSVALIAINSHSITYKNKDAEINLQGRRAASEVEYANKALLDKVETLETQIQELKSLTEQTPLFSTRPKLTQKIEEVDQAFADLKPTVAEATSNSEQLKEIITNY